MFCDMLSDITFISCAGRIPDINRKGVNPEFQPIRERNIRVTNRWRSGYSVFLECLAAPFFCVCSLFEVLANAPFPLRSGKVGNPYLCPERIVLAWMLRLIHRTGAVCSLTHRPHPQSQTARQYYHESSSGYHPSTDRDAGSLEASLPEQLPP